MADILLRAIPAVEALAKDLDFYRLNAWGHLCVAPMTQFPDRWRTSTPPMETVYILMKAATR